MLEGWMSCHHLVEVNLGYEEHVSHEDANDYSWLPVAADVPRLHRADPSVGAQWPPQPPPPRHGRRTDDFSFFVSTYWESTDCSVCTVAAETVPGGDEGMHATNSSLSRCAGVGPFGERAWDTGGPLHTLNTAWISAICSVFTVATETVPGGNDGCL